MGAAMQLREGKPNNFFLDNNATFNVDILSSVSTFLGLDAVLCSRLCRKTHSFDRLVTPSVPPNAACQATSHRRLVLSHERWLFTTNALHFKTNLSARMSHSRSMRTTVC